MLDLEAIFGSDDGPVIGAVATVPFEAEHERVLAPLDDNGGDPLFPPEVMTALRAADVRLVDDPWVNPWAAAVELPEPCERCGSLDQWLSLAGDLAGVAPGRWHCLRCNPPETARRLRGLAERLRAN